MNQTQEIPERDIQKIFKLRIETLENLLVRAANGTLTRELSMYDKGWYAGQLDILRKMAQILDDQIQTPEGVNKLTGLLTNSGRSQLADLL